MNALPNTADVLGRAALKLFREGNDTADVAVMPGVNEARASQLIWLARCRANSLPAELLEPSGSVRRLTP
jgi:hypothetical protein